MAATSRTAGEPTPPLSRLTAAATPEKAPTLIKPAWPRLSSPEMPTTRFRLRAMTI